MTGDRTTASWQPESASTPRAVGRPSLVLVGSTREPGRLGESAPLPQVPGDESTLGRQGTLRWCRQRPGSAPPTGPLGDPQLSRTQVRFWAEGGRCMAENVGRLPLRLNGRPVDRCPLEPGDLLAIADLALILVTRRPDVLDGDGREAHDWGQADDLGFVGESPAMWALRDRVAFVARRKAHVLVLGESGTGKELVARALHLRSERRRRGLVSRNAATIPESLADAELFGNLQGYPNPGMPARPGLVGESDGSTLFLDEFGELPVEQQARLLRVLDDGEYTRLGEARPRRADLRLVAATNRDPASLKHDVLARLQVRIEVPPLQTRVEDIPLLAVHLLRRLARDDAELARRFFPDGDATGHPHLTMRLMSQLLTHRYTTHVRELEAHLWHAITTAPRGLLDVTTPPPATATPAPARQVVGPTDPSALDPAVIQSALDRHGGRQEPAWRELGLASRHVLARLVKKHGLKVRGRT